MQFATATDRGRVRAQNEDFVFAGPVGAADSATLLVVADGLGGHAGGEWASRRGVECAVASVTDGTPLADTPGKVLGKALEAASATLFRETLEGIGPAGAATTLVAALIEGERLWWANIGDSRLYVVRATSAEQVTRDHSWVQEQVAAGVLTAEQAERHPRRNIITRAAGLEPDVRADTGGPITLEPGDCVLLCTDGISGVLGLSEIAEAVRRLPPAEAAAELVRLGNEGGGPDNLTAAIYRA